MSTSIVQEGNPVLRQTAAPVGPEEFGSPELDALLRRMSQALAACDDGVALAAPQIGVAKQIFIVSGKVFDEENPPADLVFINPVITNLSRTKKLLDEGCLSVRWIYGQVQRSEKATIEAQDETGRKFTRHASGLLAQIFQHEMDHLAGVLFTDKARNLQEIRPEDAR